MIMDYLVVKNIGKKHRDKWAVQDISFSIKKGEILAVVGETGSGKTTLLKMIAGLMQPTDGQIFYDNVKLKGPEEKLMPGHPKIAYLSQHFELLNNYLVKDFLEIKNKLDVSAANLIYEKCKITDLLDRKTSELSGGERQRVALAATLSTSPDLLLLDEPFSNLDAHHRTLIRNSLKEMIDELGLTVIFVSHDYFDLLSWPNKIIVLREGSISQLGDAQTIANSPQNDYVAGFFKTQA
jgi:iron(III) transport system ATP-binding protein